MRASGCGSFSPASLGRLYARATFSLAVASLAIAIGSVMQCARSYWKMDVLLYAGTRRWASARSLRGMYQFQFAQYHLAWARDMGYQIGPVLLESYGFHDPGFGMGSFWTDSHDSSMDFGMLGVAYRRRVEPRFGIRRQPSVLYMPHAVVVVAFGATSMLCFRVWRRLNERNRLLGGLCPRCGYDVRATPERCPECGREATSRRAAEGT